MDACMGTKAIGSVVYDGWLGYKRMTVPATMLLFSCIELTFYLFANELHRL